MSNGTKKITEKTFTIDQIKAQIMTEFPEEVQRTFYETYDKKLDYAATVELMGNIMDAIAAHAEKDPEEKREYADLGAFEKIAFAVREAYICGILSAFEIAADANKAGLELLLSIHE